MIATHKPIAGPEAYSPEWYKLREFSPDRKGREVIIGASEAAAACNQCQYSSALELYLIKRGEFVEEFSPEAQLRMDMGKRLEPIILDVYAERQECVLTRGLPVYFHPTWSFMAATPDAVGYKDVGETDFVEWCVDAKSTNWRMLDRSGDDDAKYGESGTDQIPTANLFQAQQQMAVMGLDRCDFPVLVDGRELRIYTVARNEDLIKQIALAEAELSERIIAGDPPEPNFEHTGTIKVLQKMFGTDFGKVVQLSEEEHDLWVRKEQLSATAKMIKEELDEISAHLAWSMQDAEIARFPDATIELKKIVVKPSVVKEYTREGYSFLKARKIG